MSNQDQNDSKITRDKIEFDDETYVKEELSHEEIGHMKQLEKIR